MIPGFNPWVRKIPWRREWLPTPVFLLGESHGQWSLAGYSPWGCKESDMSELLTLSLRNIRVGAQGEQFLGYTDKYPVHCVPWPSVFSSPWAQFRSHFKSLQAKACEENMFIKPELSRLIIDVNSTQFLLFLFISLKDLDITSPTKVHLVRDMVFPVVMYGCESWTLKKAEHRRIDAFELWCCRRLMRVPWTARRSNQSILKESVLGVHWKDGCWNWNSNTLATWCKELTHLKKPWCWERLKMGGEGDNRIWDGWMASPTQWTWVWVNYGSWWWTGKPGVLHSIE